MLRPATICLDSYPFGPPGPTAETRGSHSIAVSIPNNYVFYIVRVRVIQLRKYARVLSGVWD